VLDYVDYHLLEELLLLFLDKANAVLAATSEVPSPLVAAVIQIAYTYIGYIHIEDCYAMYGMLPQVVYHHVH